MTDESRSFRDKVDDASWAFFAIGFLCVLLTIGYEVFNWLKTGEWFDIPFYAVFTWLNIDPFEPVDGIEWQGIKKILLWFLRLPLSVMLVVLGAFLWGMGQVLESVAYPEEQDE